MKMTQDQIILLLDLKASHERDSASMSCGPREPIARQLEKLKLIDYHGSISNSAFFHINKKGLAALKRARRK